MKNHRIQGILLLLIVVICATVYHTIAQKNRAENIEVQRVRDQYRTEKIELKRRTLRRNDLLKFYGTLSLLGTINLSLLIIAGGIARAKVKTASVLTAQIGQHSMIPVHYKDLQRFYPIAINLSLAEIEASIGNSHEKAYQMSRQMMEDMTEYTRGIAGKRGLLAGTSNQTDLFSSTTTPFQSTVPTFAELLKDKLIAPEKPLIVGYAQGRPIYREFREFKSMAIAGWQGSGKTLSTAYLIASSVLAYRVQVYVVDPHQQHAESLSSLIQPLETTNLVKIINPFDTPALIHELHQRLDRRLAGEEPATQGILLVIDELARLANMDCFDELVGFLERCTAETRKANITFFGSSPKWTARYFKGRADIRGCMNSMLIHKTKPSQADLLLEDSQDKHLVKQLHRPGDAIVVTDFQQPVLVSIPRCSWQDMETVAALAGKVSGPLEIASISTKRQKTSPEIIPLDQHRRKTAMNDCSRIKPQQLTVDMIKQQLSLRKQQQPGLTQAEAASLCDMSPSLLSKILNHRCTLTEDHKQKLYTVLFEVREKPTLVMTGTY